MASTRAELRTRILRRADAVGSGRWDTTVAATGEVDQLASVAYDREWLKVLDVDAMQTAAAISATGSAAGLYALSDLTSASARLHRILGVYRGNVMYRSVPAREYLQAAAYPVGERVWFRSGASVYLLPVEASTAATFTVNSLPTVFSSLSDSGAITVPSTAQGETFEEVVALMAAAMLLDKGGAEAQAAMVLRSQADGLRREMLNDLARLAEGPLHMRYDDTPGDWGA